VKAWLVPSPGKLRTGPAGIREPVVAAYTPVTPPLQAEPPGGVTLNSIVSACTVSMKRFNTAHWFLVASITGAAAVAMILGRAGRPAFYVGETSEDFLTHLASVAEPQSRLPPFWCSTMEVAAGGNDAIGYWITRHFYFRPSHVFARRCTLVVLPLSTNGPVTYVGTTWKWGDGSRR
jgi:hypothetical protein